MGNTEIRQKKGKKQDQRVRVTKKLLRDAFLELLTEKPIHAITVRELCERAGINRATFYLHYRDVYDLLAQLEDSMIEQISDVLEKESVIRNAQTSRNSVLFMMSIFKFFRDNQDLCTIPLGPNGDKAFITRIVNLGKDKIINEYKKKYPKTTDIQAELFFAYVASGFVGLLQYDLENESQVGLEELARNAQKLIWGGITALHK